MSRRLLASYLALTLILLVALEVPLAINNDERLRTDLTANLVRDAYTMAGYAEETVEGKASVDLSRLVSNYAAGTGGRVVIVGRDGQALADSQPDATSASFATRPEISEALAGTVATGTRRSDTLGMDLLYVAVPIATADGVQGALRITYSTGQLEQRRRDYLMTLLGIAVVSLTVAAVLGLLLTRWVTRPVRLLERAAADLGAGALESRATEESGPPEVRELAHTFNQMASRIDHLVTSQAAFVADASHQLRTPLAALQLRLENLQADLEDGVAPPTADDDIDAALVETARLARIVDELLALARADASTGATVTEPVALDDVLLDRVAAWAAVAADHEIELTGSTSGLTARASPDHLRQVLDNLITNAIDASVAGGHVRVRAVAGDRATSHRRDGVIEVHVADDGPGLRADEKLRAFDRFWRASSNTAGSTLGGTGLGLAIARQYTRAGGGDIELRDAPDGGLDAVILLPRAPG